MSDESKFVPWAIGVFLVLIFSIALWDRQGVKMTQWEIFMGAKPVERVIIFK